MATAATLVTGRAQVERCQHYPDESPFVQVINEQVRSEGSNGYLSEVVVVSGLTGAMANRALHAFKGSTWNSESKRLVLGKRQTHMDMINHLSWEYNYALCHSGSPEMLEVPSRYDHRILYCWQMRNTKLVPAV